jgi:proteasome lid subunit RPN8/RPN11
VRVDRTIQAIYTHAVDVFPQECCGIVSAAGDVIPLKNQAADPYENFKISPGDFIKYSGGALCMYHSHPDRPAIASEADLECAKRMRLPLMIVSWPNGDIRMIGDPGKNLPLEGRNFIYGVNDCYSLVQNFYLREYGVFLPTVTRPRFGWWEDESMDPFTEGIACSPLVEVNTGGPGDMLLIQTPGAKTPNHTGIYMGDGTILHHKLLSLSCRSEYDELLRNATTRILRRAN